MNKIYTFFAISSMSQDINKKLILHYSTFFTTDVPNFNDIESRLNRYDLYFNDLLIFRLVTDINDKDKDLQVVLTTQSYTYSCIRIVDVSYKLFFSWRFFEDLCNFFKEKNTRFTTVLLCRNCPTQAIKIGFDNIGIQFSGGNNTLKHALSPNQFLLSKVIAIFYGMNTKLVTNSFRELSKIKSHTRPLVDYTSKKDWLSLQQPYNSDQVTEITTHSNIDEVKNQVREKKDNFNSEVINNHIGEKIPYSNTETTNNIKRIHGLVKLSNKKTVSGIQKRSFHNFSSLESHNKTNIYLPKFDFMDCFSKVKLFLDNNPINNKTQEELEKLLYDTSIDFNKDKGNNFLSFPPELRSKIYGLLPTWENYLKDLKKTFEQTKSIKNKKDFSKMTGVDKMKLLLLDIIDYMENKKIIESLDSMGNTYSKKHQFKHDKLLGKMLLCLLTIVKYNQSEEPDKHNIKTTVISSSINTGKEVVNLYLHKLFKQQDKFKSLSIFKDHITQRDEKSMLLLDDNFLAFIGGKLIDVMINSGILETIIVRKNKTRHNYLIISSKTIAKYKNMTFATPVKLPMIVKPNKHSKDVLGGYLLNDELFIDELITKKNQTKFNSQILQNNCIYNAVNGLSATPFKVNNKVLDYLLENRNEFFKEQMEIDTLDKKENLNWKDKITYKSLLSVKILKENIISIAICYSKIPNFYFPVKLDYRGRIHIIPHYFHFQSHEMAKSLLLFSNPGKLKKNDNLSIEYYKVMAANYFGNGIDKLSFNSKLTWFYENEVNIINYENRKLLNKASKKFLFLAFCIEYKSFYNFMQSDDEYFNTYLPLQLDATCNGYQHLSLLAQEKNIYKELNLEKTSKKDKPSDFYNYICTQIILNIKKLLLKNKDSANRDSFERLSKIKLDRTNFKKAIMTKPYNAAPISTMDYIKESFELKVIDNVNWYHNKNDDENMINGKDIGKLYSIFHEYITSHFDRITKLTNYLDQIATICNELNLPIKWKTPSGLLISQSYLETRERRFEPFTSRNTTISLSIVDKNKLNKDKQRSALLPNFVHSLDGATMALLYKMFSKITNGGSIAGIHDCFLVTSDNASSLLDTLKAVYMQIYVYDEYIVKFDDVFVHNLEYLAKDNEYSFDKGERKIVTVKGNVIHLPKPISVNIFDYPDLNSSTLAI